MFEDFNFKAKAKEGIAWGQKQWAGEHFGWQQGAGRAINQAARNFQQGIHPGEGFVNRMKHFGGGVAMYADKFATKQANKISRTMGHTLRFGSIGGVLAKAPIKGLAKQWAVGLPIVYGMETMFGGKSHGFGTLASAAWNDIPFTLGMNLAGGGIKGMAKHGLWQVAGETLGLGPWGSFGLQLLGQTNQGMAALTVGAVAGYKTAKGLANMHQTAYQMGKSVMRTDFVTGDTSIAAAEAATMRSRAVGAIQRSHMNMRSMLGNEAAFMMGR